MILRVKSINGRILEIECEYNSSIKDIKQYIADKEGIPAGLFCLIYGGKTLKDDRLLCDYQNITKDSLLHCVVHSFG